MEPHNTDPWESENSRWPKGSDQLRSIKNHSICPESPAVSHYQTQSHIIKHRVTSSNTCRVTSWNTESHHETQSHIMKHRVTSSNTESHHQTQTHIIKHRVTSSNTESHHQTQSHIIKHRVSHIVRQRYWEKNKSHAVQRVLQQGAAYTHPDVPPEQAV